MSDSWELNHGYFSPSQFVGSIELISVYFFFSNKYKMPVRKRLSSGATQAVELFVFIFPGGDDD